MKKLGIITIIATLGYALYNRQLPFLLNLTNAFFFIGFIYLLIAFLFYIKNIGFFKILSYNKYRNKQAKIHNEKQKKSKDKKGLEDSYRQKADIMEFHEFSNRHYNEASNKKYIIFGLALMIISFVLAFLAK